MTYMGGSLAALAADRNLWRGRANNAWGASRVWGSGSSFETDLAAMTADRDNWMNSSNTWQGRANNAWGPSRTWNSGESWEAAYNRVLPPASPVQITATQTRTNPNGHGDMCSLTTTLTGYWRLSWTATGNLDANASRATYRLYAGGAVQDTGTADVGSGVSADGKWGLTALIGPTGPVECHVNLSNEFQFTGTTGTLVATFVPTASYPH